MSNKEDLRLMKFWPKFFDNKSKKHVGLKSVFNEFEKQLFVNCAKRKSDGLLKKFFLNYFLLKARRTGKKEHC